MKMETLYTTNMQYGIFKYRNLTSTIPLMTKKKIRMVCVYQIRNLRYISNLGLCKVWNLSLYTMMRVKQ